ncbi:DUF4143 domain-containing protein [Nocardioides sp.]|uniref:DUF4143 domain-containing protein n=1 Tax=Nocardioides sp. TaxID=35761 RepID=UPI003518CB17
MVDLVARLCSRGFDPADVRGPDLEQYAALFAGRSEESMDELRARLHAAARPLRRVDSDRLLAVLTALARPPTAELNQAAVAAAAGVPATTLPPYLDVLAELDLVRWLPGARSAVANRAIARPRVVHEDVGLARRLAGVSADELTDLRGRRHLQPLLHGLVARELMGEQGAGSVPHRVAHLRERNGLAVDLLVELDDGSVIGIEVRTAAAYRPHQVMRLRSLAARAGARFRLGVVLSTAARGHWVGPVDGPRLCVLPIGAALGAPGAARA